MQTSELKKYIEKKAGAADELEKLELQYETQQVSWYYYLSRRKNLLREPESMTVRHPFPAPSGQLTTDMILRSVSGDWRRYVEIQGTRTEEKTELEKKLGILRGFPAHDKNFVELDPIVHGRMWSRVLSYLQTRG